MCNRPVPSQDDREQGGRIECWMGADGTSPLLAGVTKTVEKEERMCWGRRSGVQIAICAKERSQIF